LSPATTRTKSIRLYQVWQPQATQHDLNEDDDEGGQPDRTAARSIREDSRDDMAPERLAASRVSLLPHDPHTGAEIERGEVVMNGMRWPVPGRLPGTFFCVQRSNSNLVRLQPGQCQSSPSCCHF